MGALPPRRWGHLRLFHSLRGVGCLRSVSLVLQFLDFRFEDPQRLTQRTREVGQLLSSEEQREYDDYDHPVHGL